MIQKLKAKFDVADVLLQVSNMRKESSGRRVADLTQDHGTDSGNHGVRK
jgi:hypothetical protein